MEIVISRKIKEILLFVSKNFKEVKVLAPYEPAIHTYCALGYQSNIAARKARLNSNRLKNHVTRIIESYGLSNVQIIDWDVDSIVQKEFKQQLKYLKKLIDTSLRFEIGVKETTKKVLQE